LINTFDATFIGELTAPFFYGGGPSSFITDVQNITAENLNVTTVNNLPYPPPVTVSTINAQLSSLAVSSFVNADTFRVGSLKSVNWANQQTIISQTAVGAGLRAMNLISDGGVNVPTALNATSISTGTLVAGSSIATSLTANSGLFSTFAATGYASAINFDVTNDLQCMGEIRCDNNVVAESFNGNLANILVAQFGSLQASTMAATQLTGVSSINGTNNFLFNPNPVYSTMTTRAASISSINGTNNFLYNPNPAYSTVTAAAITTSSIGANTATVNVITGASTIAGGVGTFSNTVNVPNVTLSSISGTTVTVAGPLTARVITGVSTISAGVGAFSNSVVTPNAAVSSITGNSLAVTAPLRVANNMEVASNSTLTVGVVAGVSTINGRSVNNGALSSLTVTGVTNLSTLNVSSINATTVAVSGTTDLAQLNVSTMIASDSIQVRLLDVLDFLEADLISTQTLGVDQIANVSTLQFGSAVGPLIGVNALSSLSSINGVSYANPVFNSVNLPSSMSLTVDAGGNLAMGGPEDVTVRSNSGNLELTAGGGINIEADAVPAGSQTFIDGVNWSTLVAVVRGLSSFT
jgi:hypothetical protein